MPDIPYLSFALNTCRRSLSELDSLRLTGEAGEKIRQVTERATLFRITSNAMINVSCSEFTWKRKQLSYLAAFGNCIKTDRMNKSARSSERTFLGV